MGVSVVRAKVYPVDRVNLALSAKALADNPGFTRSTG